MQFQPAYLIIGIVFTIAAVIFKKFPPKKINMWYGYRTGLSIKNQETWEIAQEYSSKLMVIEGIILIIFGVIFGVISAQMENKVKNVILFIFIVIIIPVIFFWLIASTEIYLRKYFNKKQVDENIL